MTRPTAGCATSRCGSSPSSMSHSTSTSRGTPASHSASSMTATERRDRGSGVTITAEPVASAAVTPPHGTATGKLHAAVTTVSATGTGLAASTCSSRIACSAA